MATSATNGDMAKSKEETDVPLTTIIPVTVESSDTENKAADSGEKDATDRLVPSSLDSLLAGDTRVST
jgi:hypothetical protein